MELRDKDVSLKMLGRVLPLLDKLHLCGTERDTAGNRRLFFDDYVKLVLVYVFNSFDRFHLERGKQNACTGARESPACC